MYDYHAFIIILDNFDGSNGNFTVFVCLLTLVRNHYIYPYQMHFYVNILCFYLLKNDLDQN